MDTLRGRAATLAGAVVVCLGSWAWALAATAMTAVHSAEATALGDGHTAEMPGQDELALVAHDARLAALFVIASGLAVALSAWSRRAAVAGGLAGVAAAVVANAVLGRLVDAGPLLPATAGMAVVVALAGAAGAAVGRAPARGGAVAGPAGLGRGRGALAAAGALAAGTVPVLTFQGLASPRYAPWVPADLATSNVVTAASLALAAVVAGVLLARDVTAAVLAVVVPAAALVVLVGPAGASWQVRDASWVPGVALVLAAAPLVLVAAGERWGARRGRVGAAVGLLVAGAGLALAPQVLAAVALIGGMLSMAVTGPAGAYINYDGLPVVGGGALIGAVVLAVHLALRPEVRLVAAASAGGGAARRATTHDQAPSEAG